ncbi:NAD(P)H-binding protein [Paracoccus aerodenitrificans]|uniref:NAD(P)H-binding protein n=1 Tax=Paracoccus aerodenitrificans TaxID=3017781 RepID=UPI0022F0A5D4|nr:NAD(P)H-binding protein [Paracoccus aerodenitrificans]WBU64596.1 NAD(P)H-binding protein [Paracoccus aerodenitrificans]
MILVTGASGQLASQIVVLSRQLNLPVLTASRSPAADRVMDFDDPTTLDFDGIDVLFLTSAGYAEDDVVMRRHGAVLEAARKQGVRHVIYTSLSEASDHLVFALAHRWTEREIKASGMSWTIMRNGLYAELIGALATPQGGRIITPFGQGRISAVARHDLALAAVRILANPSLHAGRSYELAGCKAFSLPELAESIGASYRPGTFADERLRLAGLSLLPFQPPMLLSISSTAAAGFLEAARTDLLELVPEPADALAVASSIAQASG